MGIDIVEYLNHLLYRNNLAILPGFGAFTSTLTPAVIDHARGTMQPPSKIISFNENLKVNDGFLINLIKNKHGIAAQEARIIVENFVKSVKGVIANDESVLFDKIGKIRKNVHGNLEFSPEGKTNFNANTYGLPTFKAQPLPRINTPSILEKNISQSTDNQQFPPSEAANNNVTVTENKEEIKVVTPNATTSSLFSKRSVAIAAFGVIATTLLVGINWYQKSDKTSKTHQAITISEERVNVKPMKEDAIVSQENTKENTQTIDTQTTLLPEQKQKKIEEKIEEKIVAPTPEKRLPSYEDMTKGNSTEKQFSHVIYIGSFSKESNAQKNMRKLRRKGYTPLREKKNGLRRVGTLITFDNESEKMEKINRLKNIFGSAWEKK